MKKLSSYQKLKAENRRLKQDIYDLVMRRNEFQGLCVYTRYKLNYTQTDIMMFGNRTFERPAPGIGIMAQIKGSGPNK